MKHLLMLRMLIGRLVLALASEDLPTGGMIAIPPPLVGGGTESGS